MWGTEHFNITKLPTNRNMTLMCLKIKFLSQCIMTMPTSLTRYKSDKVKTASW